MNIPRSKQKIITIEAKILRYMRLSRGLSLCEAGARVKISGSAVAHIEQGRMNISEARLKTLISVYKYEYQDYLDFCDGRELPRNYRDECILMMRLCDDAKIKMLHPIISSLTQ